MSRTQLAEALTWCYRFPDDFHAQEISFNIAVDEIAARKFIRSRHNLSRLPNYTRVWPKLVHLQDDKSKSSTQNKESFAARIRSQIESGQRPNLSGVDLRKADLSELDLSGMNFENSDLRQTNLFSVNLANANLSRARLLRSNLMLANLQNANLFLANLSGAVLYGADLRQARLLRANLTGAYLVSVNLSDAVLRHAILIKTILDHANLTNADLEGADLYGARGERVITDGVQWPTREPDPSQKRKGFNILTPFETSPRR